MTLEQSKIEIRKTKLKLKLFSPKWIVTALVILAAALLPLLTDNTSTLNLFFLVYLFITLSSSWNMLAGFAGQISLGHAAFFGIGALVMRTLWLGGMNYLLALPIAGIVAGLCALVIGVPTFRLRGIYFSIGTLALAEALRLTISNLLPNISTMPIQAIAEYELTSRYYLALGVAVITLGAAYMMLRSRLSLGLFAIREDEEAAQATGVRPALHKLAASGISSFFAGIAGAVFAFHQVSYYPAAAFGPHWTFDALLITFVGGLGTLLGPVLGALFFVLLREQIALVLGNWSVILFGVLFIIVVLALPGGLMDLGGRIQKRFRR